METHAHIPFHRPTLVLLGAVAALAIAAIPLGAAFAQTPSAPFTVIESNRGFARLQDAVDAIGNGQGSIAIAPGRYAQCAVQAGGDIAYLAVEPGKSVFDGVTCEGKAALVLRGRSAEVAGLVFENMAVPDYNGAGIRLEEGNLTVAQSWFRNSQQGILTGHNAASRLVVDSSTFTRLGNCADPSGCAHSIYTGEIAQVRVTRSRFEEGAGGHYLKSRAKRVEVASSSFDDARGHETNYMIDLPNGATGQISNNWFVQGQDKDNWSAFIAVSAENHENSSAGLMIVGNDARLAPGIQRTTAFVADWSGDKLNLGENALGPGLKSFEER